jgi:hypothetical protein
MDYSTLSDETLAAYAVTKRAEFTKFAAIESPSLTEVEAAEALAAEIEAIEQVQADRADLATRAASLKTKFAPVATETEPEVEAETEAEKAEDEDDEEEDATAEVEEEPVKAASKSVATLAAKATRPAVPETQDGPKPVSIIASADVPGFATGAALDMVEVGKAMVNRMKGFGTPTGDGTSENLQHYGVAQFALDFEPEFTVDRHSDDMEVLNYAANEHRLPGGSLVAAGGWCAPSETIYDLCGGASSDGMLSLPEINVARGGIKYTRGPDFSALYAAGFCQTEAQAIAGTTKPCYEVPCPPFVEVRLDACGICIKVPILTQAAYPELVAATISEAMIAHQHAMNAKIVAQVATLIGAATAFTGLGAASTDTLDALLLASANLRQKYRLGLNESLEVIAPFWAKDVLLSDVARRNGGGYGVPTDADVSAIFAAANTHVQYIYDWEPLPAAATAWPDTIPVLIYPAGAFVVGKADVINLNAVYDAASLAVNTYTGLFFEQGILVAPLCRNGVAVDIPVCNAGRTGINDLTCSAVA